MHSSKKDETEMWARNALHSSRSLSHFGQGLANSTEYFLDAIQAAQNEDTEMDGIGESGKGGKLGYSVTWRTWGYAKNSLSWVIFALLAHFSKEAPFPSCPSASHSLPKDTRLAWQPPLGMEKHH